VDALVLVEDALWDDRMFVRTILDDTVRELDLDKIVLRGDR
jgi:hypothetical protein